ncbi:MAG: M20/M25/M40 family metallo-hydrolase [Planctomycetes bacterium]|nr:M20/M25/M40 family metallo-hydrolase [Planctomycetota bacterium]
MRSALAAVFVLTLAACAAGPAAAPTDHTDVPGAPRVATPFADNARDAAQRIVDAIATDSRAQARLRHLCDEIGPRLSGSEGLASAVEWTVATLRADGLDARQEFVAVPHWIRGRESATAAVVSATGGSAAPGSSRELRMLGLGNSVGTPPEGVEGEVVAVRDFDHLESIGAAVRGKIVLFTKAMPPYDAEKGAGYGETVVYRTQGASRAAKLGAVAVLVRSVTATSLSTPHTGSVTYAVDQPRIPAAALSIEDADWLARRVEDVVADGRSMRVRLRMEARFEPDAPSANVVADLRGSERPDEIVLIGAHLDSWDVGQGAHDDGANCMAVMEAMRTLQRLGLRPRRTIRAVLFVNEENGLRGAIGYATSQRENVAKHVVAIEADAGCYRPLGFTTPASDDPRVRRFRERMQDVMTLLAPLGADRLRDGGGGADIGLLGQGGVQLLGLDVEGSRYFDIHHTAADTFDKVAKEDIDRVAAVLAITAFAIADAPIRVDE